MNNEEKLALLDKAAKVFAAVPITAVGLDHLSSEEEAAVSYVWDAIAALNK